MKLSKPAILIIAVIAVIAVSLVAVVMIKDNQVEDNNGFVGKWNLAMVSGMDSEGEYFKDVSKLKFFGESIDPSKMDLNVGVFKEGMFTADFLGMKICGEMRNQDVRFEFDNENYHITFKGYASGNDLTGSLLYSFNSGKNTKVLQGNTAYALQCRFFKSGADIKNMVSGADAQTQYSIDDMLGVNMRAAYSYALLASGERYNLDMNDNQILRFEQTKGMLFHAHMEQHYISPVTNTKMLMKIPLVGSVNMSKNNGVFGSAMDDRGRYWELEIYESKAVILRSVDMLDTVLMKDQIAAITCLYYNGEPNPALIPTPKTYDDSLWMSEDTKMLTADGKYREVTAMATLKFGKSADGLVYVKYGYVEMFYRDMAGRISNSSSHNDMEVFFLDDKGRQYVASLRISDDGSKLVLVSTYMGKPMQGNIFTMEFQRVQI